MVCDCAPLGTRSSGCLHPEPLSSRRGTTYLLSRSISATDALTQRGRRSLREASGVTDKRFWTRLHMDFYVAYVERDFSLFQHSWLDFSTDQLSEVAGV